MYHMLIMAMIFYFLICLRLYMRYQENCYLQFDPTNFPCFWLFAKGSAHFMHLDIFRMIKLNLRQKQCTDIFLLLDGVEVELMYICALCVLYSLCRNISKLSDEWFADEEKVRHTVGLLLNGNHEPRSRKARFIFHIFMPFFHQSSMCNLVEPLALAYIHNFF